MTPPPPSAAAAAPPVRPRSRPLASPGRAARAPLVPAGRPRRISGPARPASPVSARRAARPVATPAPAIVDRAGRLLDRLIHGRAWIALVAFALIGIVTMQLGLLKLNAGIGRALEHVASLQRENAGLSVEDSSFAAGDAVQLQAAHLGMQIAPSGTTRFLSGHDPGGEAARAAAALRADATRAAEAVAPSAEAPAPTGEAVSAGTEASAPTGEAASAGTEAPAGESSQSEAESGQG